MAAVAGPGEALEAFLGAVELPPDAEVLGPVPLPGRRGEPSPGERALVRVPPGSGAALAAALKSAQAARMARGVAAADAVRIRIDPPDIG
ncbi:putative primosomal protein N' OS=Streptomyces lavendulae subsp. lavendulae OX=58340 GN=priA2 PE=3 SV=1 [Streptomyces lavendulae subsp. lavendulae]